MKNGMKRVILVLIGLIIAIVASEKMVQTN